MTARPLRFGVVGIGYGQQVLVPAIRQVPGCDVVAIAASTQERAENVANRLGVPRAYGGWSDLVEAADVDAVAIALPPDRQPEVALAAVARGKPILCEKPLATTVADAERITRAARERNVVGMVDFQFPFLEAWSQTRRALADGAIGSIRHATIVWQVETYASRARLSNWKTSHEHGGGALSNMGSHTLQYSEWLFGPAVDLSARLASWPDARLDETGDTLAMLTLGLAIGGTVSATIGTNAPNGSGHRLEVYGDDGVLVLENPGPDYMRGFRVTVRRRGESEASELFVDESDPGADGRIPPVVGLVSQFARAVRDGADAWPGVEQGRRVQVLLEAAGRAAEAAMVVPVAEPAGRAG